MWVGVKYVILCGAVLRTCADKVLGEDQRRSDKLYFKSESDAQTIHLYKELEVLRESLDEVKRDYDKLLRSVHQEKDGVEFADRSRPSSDPSFGPGLPYNINGIFPDLAVTADSAPKRSECGTGALMPWADRLYVVSYLSVPDAGSGTGLYAIDRGLQMTQIASHNSTFANRLLHKQSNQVIIGAWVIDAAGGVRVFASLLHVRIAATAEHLTSPALQVYMLGMDGPLWECDVYTLACFQLFDLVDELHIPAGQGEQPHFKAAHTMAGRLVVASNTFTQADYLRDQSGGRLAEWMGYGTPWKILAKTAFVEVTGRANFGKVIYATGWDDRSAILKVLDCGDSGELSNFTTWQTYRLPKASHAFDHLWQTEWPRIREVETERYLADIHGQFYELSPLGWAGSTFGLRPIAQHLRVIPDFTSYRGMLVLGGNQVSSIFDNNLVTGQSQSGLWFGKTDDLWQFGKPQGWGGVWRRDAVVAEVPSDPFLLTGFDKKILHLRLHEQHQSIRVSVLVDFTGAAGHIQGEDWVTLEVLGLSTYVSYIFPSGFSAHWVKLVSDTNCTLTAYFHFS